jgi:pyridoxal phosphate enzyme (YggS family)
MNEQTRKVLADRLDSVHERIASACRRVRRNPDDVTLVAVTKTVSERLAALLPELGVLDLGENRPQELWRKTAILPANIRWHMIGHLQRNKVERTLPLVQLVHAVDSLRLLDALEAEAARQGRTTDILIEVNASREASKHGFVPEEVSALAGPLLALRHVHVRGLMTMAAFEEDPEKTRPVFAQVRHLRDALSETVGQQHALDHLSMGMSNDFEVAIEEGATLVRLGTVLFEGLSEGES